MTPYGYGLVATPHVLICEITFPSFERPARLVEPMQGKLVNSHAVRRLDLRNQVRRLPSFGAARRQRNADANIWLVAALQSISVCKSSFGEPGHLAAFARAAEKGH